MMIINADADKHNNNNDDNYTYDKYYGDRW